MGKPAGPMTDEESAAMFAAWSPEGSMPYGKQPTKKPNSTLFINKIYPLFILFTFSKL